MNMNSPTGKKILALVRKGDYAHAGEEEAVDIVFKNIPKDPARALLDIGCGRGGTAHYVQSKGWGKVTGVDIDTESIAYAGAAYPEIDLITADAMSLKDKVSKKFDIIYLFNALYALPDHPRLLEQLRNLARPGGQLIVFDYLRKSDKDTFPFKDWNALYMPTVRDAFSASGWQVGDIIDISRLYEKWYGELVSRIKENAAGITSLAGEEWFDFVKAFYQHLLESIEKGVLGGAIIYSLSSQGNPFPGLSK